MVLKAGFAVADITPPIGTEIAGYGFGPSVGVLDALEAQVLWLESGEERLVLAAADLLTFGPESLAAVRRDIARETGIPAERVLVAASHSHSAATLMPLRQWGKVDERYARDVEQKIVDATLRARTSSGPARVGLGCGSGSGLLANRRKGMSITDAAVPVLRVDSPDGTALVYGFGCHPVTLHGYRNLLSADYPGFVRRRLRETLGRGVAPLFLLGTAGDINPAGYVHAEATEERLRKLGEPLAAEVARVAGESRADPDTTIRFRREIVELPVVELPPRAELVAVRERFAREARDAERAGRPWAERAELEANRDWAKDALAERERGQRRTVSCEVAAARIGSTAVLFAPLEMFTATGLAIRHSSPFALTLIASNSNGCLGYLPTADAYLGPDYTNPQGLAPKVYGVNAFSPEAEPLFRARAVELIGGLA
jgi:neutral ceramidase